MSKSITIKSIDVDQESNLTTISIGKYGWQFPLSTKAELLAVIKERMSEDSQEFLLFLALALWAKRDPTLSNPGMVIGKTLTFDLSGPINTANGIVRLG